MRARLGDPLPNAPLSVCTNCGQRSFLVKQPNGTNVALADIPGPYLIRDGIAYLSATNDGYGKHAEICTHKLAALPTTDPEAAEFMWLSVDP